jgi:hypothetical protein
MENKTVERKAKALPPEKKFASRNLVVNVWKKTNQFGTFRQVSIDKSYLDSVTNEWKKAYNYTSMELPNLIELIMAAQKFILEQEKNESMNQQNVLQGDD